MPSTISQREIIFISHALPEDNEFVLWLASRLRNEGYLVWCELNEIHGGEHFWKKIQPIIRNQAAKFIFVASHVSVSEEKVGVRDEWDYAKTIEREFKINEFIIPINLDGVSSNAIIGMAGIAMLQFQNSWAAGLKALIKKLQKDNVPKQTENSPLSVAHWLTNRYGQRSGFFQKEEVFYSNWLDFPQLPDAFYMHEYSNKEQTDIVVSQMRTGHYFPIVQHERFVISFAKTLPEINTPNSESIFESVGLIAKKTILIETKKVLARTYQSNEFPTTRDASNFLVQLLRQCVHEFLESVGLQTYLLANEKSCYYYQKESAESPDVTVKFDYQGKAKSRQLTGKYFDDVWHFGVSFNPRLRPHPCISFKGHIIFSKDGHTIWPDKKKLHAARRKKGKRMYNAAWRDLWLAFLNSLSEDQQAFAVPITSDDRMWLSTLPVMFSSDRGYEDPQDNERLTPIDDFDDEQEADDIDDFLSDEADDSLHEELASDLNDAECYPN